MFVVDLIIGLAATTKAWETKNYSNLAILISMLVVIMKTSVCTDFVNDRIWVFPERFRNLLGVSLHEGISHDSLSRSLSCDHCAGGILFVFESIILLSDKSISNHKKIIGHGDSRNECLLGAISCLWFNYRWTYPAPLKRYLWAQQCQSARTEWTPFSRPCTQAHGRKQTSRCSSGRCGWSCCTLHQTCFLCRYL